jgi:Phage minor capsid protein 2.
MSKLDQYSLRDLFIELELELIESLKRNLKRHEREELKRGFQWEQWQKAKLRSIEEFRRNNKELIATYHKDIMETIESVLEVEYQDAYKQSLELFDDIEMDLAGFDNSTDLGMPEVKEDNFFQVNDEKLKSLIEEMQTDFSKIDSKIMRNMDEAYKGIINKAVLKVGSGTKTIRQAVDEVSKGFLENGVDCIIYKDGKRVNIANYAEMYLRTASQRATFMAQGKVRDRIGVYTILISQHANCCPKCLKWQGRVLIDDVFTSLTKAEAIKLSRSTGYPLLSTAMEEGFLHPNCRHSITTYFEDKTTKPKEFTKAEKAEALRKYYEEQRQRFYEREIRKWKRIAEGSLDDRNVEKAKEYARYYQGRLRQHIKNNPNLRRQYWRERINPTVNA